MKIDATPPPVSFADLDPAHLHDYYSFLDRGLTTIRRKVVADWLVFDVLSAIRAKHATCLLVSRGERLLGFVLWYLQPRAWSGKLDLFIWCAYAIPFRERIATDNVPEAIMLTWQYLGALRTKLKAHKIVWITTRRGFDRLLGIRPQYFTYMSD